jgi:hypothetical protein
LEATKIGAVEAVASRHSAANSASRRDRAPRRGAAPDPPGILAREGLLFVIRTSGAIGGGIRDPKVATWIECRRFGP